MENLLLKKLQLRPGFKVLVINAPENFFSIIGEYHNKIDFSFHENQNCDAILIFAITKSELNAIILRENQFISKTSVSWIIYPKSKTKLASDLNLMQSWEDLKTYKLTPCSSAAIDEIWTAIRVKQDGDQKKSGTGNTEIKQNEFGNYIDVSNKKVNLPEDLKQLLVNNQLAFNFYETLSYSNRKEYVLLILTAKQESTRKDRLVKTVEKLLAGKRNPFEK